LRRMSSKGLIVCAGIEFVASLDFVSVVFKPAQFPPNAKPNLVDPQFFDLCAGLGKNFPHQCPFSCNLDRNFDKRHQSPSCRPS
jgi:hypothetical protein